MLELGPIKVKGVIFCQADDTTREHKYIVGLDDMTELAFLKAYCGGRVRSTRATGLNMDGNAEKFYLLAVQDCFDPPIAIVRACDEQDAEESFIDQLPWAHIDDDRADPEREAENAECPYSYGPRGQRYDGERIYLREVVLVGIIPA